MTRDLDTAGEVLTEHLALTYALSAVRGDDRAGDEALMSLAGRPGARVMAFAVTRRAIELICEGLPIVPTRQLRQWTREDVASLLQKQLAEFEARHPATTVRGAL